MRLGELSNLWQGEREISSYRRCSEMRDQCADDRIPSFSLFSSVLRPRRVKVLLA